MDMLAYRLEHESHLKNVPDVTSEYGIGCTFDEASNRFMVHSTNPDNTRRLNIDDICGTSKESIAHDIASIMRRMRMIGFLQGRKHVRLAMGLHK